MALNKDFRTPSQATGAARAAAEAIAGALPLAAYMPEVANPTLNYQFNANDPTQIDLGEFRSYDTEAPRGREFGVATYTGKLPPLSRRYPVSEYLELELQGQASLIGAKIDQYVENLTRALEFRLEFARAEVLRTGKLHLEENNLFLDIDFKRPSDQTVTLTGTDLWSNADAKPVSDVIAWQQLVADVATAPSTMLITLAVMNALSTNKEVIAYAVGKSVSSSDLPDRVTFDAVRAVFSGFGLLNVQVLDEAYRHFTFPSQLFPTGTVLLLPSPGDTVFGGSLGSTQLGVPAEALQPSYGISASEQAGFVSAVYDRESPVGLEVLVSGIALPVLTNAKATFAATVL